MSWAALCPGQLSERRGMGLALAAEFPAVRAWFDEVSEASGIDVEATFAESGTGDIHADRPAQVGVYAVSVAVLDVMEREGLRPAAAAGYSLGHYAAFYAAGSVDRRGGLDILLEVLRILDDEPVPGAMGFVIGLGRPEIEAITRQVSLEVGDVFVATQNAARQLVITGEVDAVRAAVARASETALKAEVLPLSVPMHSPLLGWHSDRLAEFMRERVEVREPTRCKLYSPMLARAVESAKEAAIVLSNQFSRPSLWSDTLQALSTGGIRRFVETGPGDVLSKMLRWTVREAEPLAAQDPESIRQVGARIRAGQETIR